MNKKKDTSKIGNDKEQLSILKNREIIKSEYDKLSPENQKYYSEIECISSKVNGKWVAEVNYVRERLGKEFFKNFLSKKIG